MASFSIDGLWMSNDIFLYGSLFRYHFNVAYQP